MNDLLYFVCTSNGLSTNGFCIKDAQRYITNQRNDSVFLGTNKIKETIVFCFGCVAVESLAVESAAVESAAVEKKAFMNSEAVNNSFAVHELRSFTSCNKVVQLCCVLGSQ